MRDWLQVACTCLLLTALSCVEADGEVGQAPNDCYTTMPTDLPVTVSYSKSATPTNVSFNFLVNVRLATVTAFGIRLNDDLAAMAFRIAGIPAGQLSSLGPAYVWTITTTGLQLYTFTVDTTGLTNGTGPNAVPDLSDICAQGIQVADDQGNLLWQQPSPASTCIAWVKQGDDCSFQTITDNQGPSLSPKLDLPMYYSPAPVLYQAAYSSSPQSYGGYYAYTPPAYSFVPSLTSPTPLFGIQATPVAYSPSLTPSPASYSPAPVPYQSSPAAYSPALPPATLFGSPMVSSPAAASLAYSSPDSSGGYGLTAPAPAPSPGASPSYGMTGTGGYYAPATYSSSSRVLLSTPTTPATPALGVHRALSILPLFSRLVTPSAVPLVASKCNLTDQQAEPACMQQGMCGSCFKSKIGLLGLSAVLNTEYNEDLNQTSYTVSLASANKTLTSLQALSLRVSHSALSPEPTSLILESHPGGAPHDLPQQHSSWHRSCDNGLQSSLSWIDIQLDNGQATLLAVFQGKVDLLEEHILIVDSKGETKLLAEAGTAVIVVNQAGRCYYQTVPL